MTAVLCWDLLNQAVSILCIFIVKVKEYVLDKLGAKTFHLFLENLTIKYFKQSKKDSVWDL